jgi:hypothetical protein
MFVRVMRVLGVFVAVFALAFTSRAQWGVDCDTLKPAFDFYGSVASIDSLLQNSRSTFSNFGLKDGIFYEAERLYAPLGSMIHRTQGRAQRPYFTALPFLGFNYAFGTQGSQHIALLYAQSFKHHWLVNAQFLSHRSQGFVRNSAWRNRNVNVDLMHRGLQWRSHVQVEHHQDYRQFSGGILNDSLLDYVALNLVAVRKDSCVSTVGFNQLSWTNDINFLRDSVRFFGLLHRSVLQNYSREYLERDTLLGLYPWVYFDSLLTADRTEHTTIKNAMGVGTNFNKWRLEVLTHADYWRYRMNGIQRDTLELGVNSSLFYRFLNTSASINYKINLLGAFNASEFRGTLNHRFKDGNSLGATVYLGHQAPDVLQRFYFGNTLQQHLSSINLQRVSMFRLMSSVRFYGFIVDLSVHGMMTSKVYQYDGNFWSNSALASEQQLLQLNVLVAKSSKGFTIRPEVNYLLQKLKVLPSLGLGGSLEYQGYITKSKSLFFFGKLRYRFFKDYRPMTLVPQLSVLDFSGNAVSFYHYHLLNCLIGFKVKTFQFYLSGENLGSFFMSNRQPLLTGIPIPTWQLKLGITWVFWN